MIERRLQNARGLLQNAGVDYLALVPGYNLTYLTGHEFMLLERPFLAFFPADEAKDIVLVLPTLEYPAWERDVPLAARAFTWTDAEGPEGAMAGAAAHLGEAPVLAAEHLRMRLQEYYLISRHLPGAKWVSAEEVIAPVRMRKDSAEIESMREAVRIAEAALEQTVGQVKPGMTEREICNILTSEMLGRGGEGFPFEPLVLAGEASGQPHGRTGARTVDEGGILLFDFGTIVNGYPSDITRTFVVGGEPEEKFREVYEIVKAANAAGCAAAKPGVPCQEVDRAARRVIEDAGYGEYFIHRTGHGLGLDIHEDPNMVEGNDLPLAEGMTFTVEPGIYIEGWGGVRIEDNLVVTADGAESLTTFSRELRVIGA
jgi:Xaa-Pro dipeptidase